MTDHPERDRICNDFRLLASDITFEEFAQHFPPTWRPTLLLALYGDYMNFRNNLYQELRQHLDNSHMLDQHDQYNLCQLPNPLPTQPLDIQMAMQQLTEAKDYLKAENRRLQEECEQLATQLESTLHRIPTPNSNITTLRPLNTLARLCDFIQKESK
jgi:hypothetical protein